MAEQKMETLMEQWQFVCRDLRRKVGDSAFESWLEPMALGGFRDGILSLYLPTRFMRDYIVRHFADDVSEIWREHNPEIESLVFDVGRPTASALPNSYAAPTVAEPQPAEVPDMPEPAEKDDLSAALDPRFTFDNFVVGKPNVPHAS